MVETEKQHMFIVRLKEFGRCNYQNRDIALSVARVNVQNSLVLNLQCVVFR